MSSSRRKNARLGFLELLLVIAVPLLFLTGCGSDAPFAIPLATLIAVLKAVHQANGLNLNVPEDRHKLWFAFRRAELIGSRNSGWTEAQVTARINTQFALIVTFLNERIGPGGPLEGFVDTSTPGGASNATNNEGFTSSPQHHLDLANVAITMVRQSSAGKEKDFLTQRHEMIKSIVWHAAGNHDEVWNENGDGQLLLTPVLDELLDRRLRSVERMVYQANGPGGDNRALDASGRGNWFDDSRVRIFEYPDNFDESLINPADVGHIWQPQGDGTVRYIWFDYHELQTRFNPEPTSNATGWIPGETSQGPVPYVRVPGTTQLMQASLDALFQSRTDVWDRTWLYCDHAIALMHLEAARFALLRRNPSANFDTLVRPKGPYLAGLIGRVRFDEDGEPYSPDEGQLFQDGVRTGPGDDDGFFDNLFLKFREAQVGDHVILWNHHLYVFVTTGAWRLENALITKIDPITTGYDNEDRLNPALFMSSSLKKLTFEGFGADGNFEAFQDELFAAIEHGFASVQEQAKNAGDAGQSAFVVQGSAARAVVVRWQPYSTGFPGFAWFIFLSRVVPGDPPNMSPYPTKEKMVEIIKGSLIEGDDRGNDYNALPTSVTIDGETHDLEDGVFFPLDLPRVDIGQLGSPLLKEMSWQELFDARDDNSSLQVESLVPNKVAASDVPSIFVRGRTEPFQVIRPRARP